jgi:hypothetical protein
LDVYGIASRRYEVKRYFCVKKNINKDVHGQSRSFPPLCSLKIIETAFSYGTWKKSQMGDTVTDVTEGLSISLGLKVVTNEKEEAVGEVLTII